MRDSMLIISIIVVSTSADAYALSFTSGTGELSWKNMASGKLAVGWLSDVGM